MKTAERQFTTISGVPVERVYGPGDFQNPQPGEFPYTRGIHRDPAQCDVDDYDEPLRRVDPHELEEDAAQGSCPHDDEDRKGKRTVESEQGERRVGARDE